MDRNSITRRMVESATDVERMRGLFQFHLCPSPGQEWDIQEVRLQRIRHRPGIRAIVQYALRLCDPRNGRSLEQWVTGTIYPGDRAAHLARKLARHFSPADDAAFPFRLVAHLPELSMLVQLFPFDRRLPGLLGFVRDPLTTLRTALPDSPWETCDLTPVRYRAGVSAVARCQLVSGPDKNPETLFAKVYPDDENGPRTLELLTTVRNSQGPIRCVRPLAYDAAQRILFLEGAAGETLKDLLLRTDGLTEVRQFGKSLAHFHQTPVRFQWQHKAAQQIANVTRAAARLARACPDLRPEVGAALQTASNLHDCHFGPTHRDLKTEHVFWSADGATLIDWDACADADPLLDIAMLAARIVALSGPDLGQAARFTAARDALLAEYFCHVPASWRNQFREHWSGALLEVAAGFGTRQEPRWKETVEYLLTQITQNPLLARETLGSVGLRGR